MSAFKANRLNREIALHKKWVYDAYLNGYTYVLSKKYDAVEVLFEEAQSIADIYRAKVNIDEAENFFQVYGLTVAVIDYREVETLSDDGGYGKLQFEITLMIKPGSDFSELVDIIEVFPLEVASY